MSECYALFQDAYMTHSSRSPPQQFAVFRFRFKRGLDVSTVCKDMML